MMMDLTVVDEWFEAGKNLPCGPVRFAVFDRSVLFTLDQLASAVQSESGEPCTIEVLQKKAAEGWHPLLARPGTQDELGTPMYVASRVGLYLQLERQGWTNAELSLAAGLEEGSIDALTDRDFGYYEDDLDTIAAHCREQITTIKMGTIRKGTADDPVGHVVDRTENLERAQRELERIMQFKQTGIPPDRVTKLAKRAYRIRAYNELIRLHIIESDRAKLRAGYGPSIFFNCVEGWGRDSTYDPKHIDWDTTLRIAYADADPAAPVLRVDGFVLAGDKVVSTRTMRPRDYDAAWQRQRIDEYLLTWARLQGEKRCLHCFAPLPLDSKDSRRFCNNRCRSAEKMKRHRRENPEAVLRAQEKYWKT